MTKEQLNKEKILTKVTISEMGTNINPQYKEKLINKIKMIEESTMIRTGIEHVNFKFMGLPSYDLRV